MRPWSQEAKNNAVKHYQEVSKAYSKEIENSIVNTSIYTGSVASNASARKRTIELIDKDSVSRLMEESMDGGKVCVLNYASYKKPGGGFLEGALTQEESLCLQSTLFPVLCAFNDTYYFENRKNLKRGMYTNRALYSPDIIFMNGNKTRAADVITCAAPNYKVAGGYHNVSRTENHMALRSRIEFIYNICQEKKVDTLIAGAWGCGVFGQDPSEVCELLIGSKNRPAKLIFAIPDASSRNYQAFFKKLEEEIACWRE